jgi:hypothetical protein
MSGEVVPWLVAALGWGWAWRRAQEYEEDRARCVRSLLRLQGEADRLSSDVAELMRRIYDGGPPDDRDAMLIGRCYRIEVECERAIAEHGGAEWDSTS